MWVTRSAPSFLTVRISRKCSPIAQPVKKAWNAGPMDSDETGEKNDNKEEVW